jgi:hypothetical protein
MAVLTRVFDKKDRTEVGSSAYRSSIGIHSSCFDPVYPANLLLRSSLASLAPSLAKG